MANRVVTFGYYQQEGYHVKLKRLQYMIIETVLLKVFKYNMSHPIRKPKGFSDLH